MPTSFKFLIWSSAIFLPLINHFKLADCHGRLLEPPARNTLWRFGYKALANYNDNELFCGGIGVSSLDFHDINVKAH